jgi:exopolysaccharide production protein ExoZ
MPQSKILSLQIGRGMAALGVVLFHSNLLVQSFVEPLPAPLAAVLKEGYLGVDFFFVASGFIILNSHFDDRPGVVVP